MHGAHANSRSRAGEAVGGGEVISAAAGDTGPAGRAGAAGRPGGDAHAAEAAGAGAWAHAGETTGAGAVGDTGSATGAGVFGHAGETTGAGAFGHAGSGSATSAGAVGHVGGGAVGNAGSAAHAGAAHGGSGIHPAILLRAAVIIPALVAAVALSAFAWSAARLAPRGVPVGVAGTAQLAGAIGYRLDGLGGAFDAHRYSSEAAAETAIRHREIYGAFVAGPGGLTVLTAPAASPAVATLLTKVGEEAGQHAAAGRAVPVRVVDVVPADPSDPQGIVLDSAFLPLVIIGSIGGVMTWVAGRDGRMAGYPQAGVLLVKSVLVALVVVGIVQGWLGVIPGDWVTNAGVIGLTVIAISSTVCGLGALLGAPGVALGGLLMVFVGNPFSGVSSAPQLLPNPAGTLGQLLPPGAGGSLLRSAAFFHGYGSGAHLVVLAIWAGCGLTAVMAGQAVRRRRAAAAGRHAEMSAEPGVVTG